MTGNSLILLAALLLISALCGRAISFGSKAPAAIATAPVPGPAPIHSWRGLFSRSRAQSNSNRNGTTHNRRLLPRLPPHPDTVYLLELVTSDNAPLVAQMEPLVERLQDDLGTTVRKININTRPDGMMLFEAVGGLEGGSVPFFYNRRSTRAICGASAYDNLQIWASGAPFHSFQEHLKLNNKRSVYDTKRKMRTVGMRDRVMEIYNRVVNNVERKGKKGRKQRQKIEEFQRDEPDE